MENENNPDSIPAQETVPAEGNEAPLEGNAEPVETPEIEGGAETSAEISPSTANEPTGEEKTAPEAPPKTLKIGDKEVPLEEVQKAYEKVEETNKLSEQAQQRVGLADAVLRFIGEKPKDAFLHILSGKLGSKELALTKWREICESQVLEDYKLSQMTDEQRALHEANQKLEEERRKNEETQRRYAQAEQTHAQQVILKEINEALTKAKVDPKSGIVYDVARVLLRTRQEGHMVSAEEALQVALEELEASESERLKRLPVDRLQGLRPDLKEHILKQSIQAAKDKRGTFAKTPATGEQRTRTRGPKIVSSGDFRKMFEVET